jgi:hypothetical protein
MGRYALLIGTSQYQDPRLSKLLMPQADVEALSSLLSDPSIGAFDEVRPLIDQPDHEVRRAISRFFRNRGRPDFLLMYFSGHGVKDNWGHLHLTFYNTEHDDLAGTAIRDTFVAEQMDASRSQAQLLILDCCYSGAFGTGAKAALGTSAGVRESFQVEQGIGRYVLTATDELQFAWEGDRILGWAEHSLFTHFLIQGLESGEADADQDGRVTVEELHEYIFQQIQAETTVQEPQLLVRTGATLGDVVVALNPMYGHTGPRLPEDVEQALDSKTWTVRWGAVAALIEIARGDDPELVALSRRCLQDVAQHDPNGRVRDSARSLFEEEKTRQRAEEAWIRREEVRQRRETEQEQAAARAAAAAEVRQYAHPVPAVVPVPAPPAPEPAPTHKPRLPPFEIVIWSVIGIIVLSLIVGVLAVTGIIDLGSSGPDSPATVPAVILVSTDTPTPTPTETPTQTPGATPTRTPTAEPSHTATPDETVLTQTADAGALPLVGPTVFIPSATPTPPPTTPPTYTPRPARQRCPLGSIYVDGYCTVTFQSNAPNYTDACSRCPDMCAGVGGPVLSCTHGIERSDGQVEAFCLCALP